MLREEVFALTYTMPGMGYSDVEGMLAVDRVWYLKRLQEQFKAEADEIKKKTPKSPRQK